MHSGRLFSVSVIWLVVTASAAWAEQARTNVGVLTCTLDKPDNDVGQKMTCGFKAAGTGADEKYSGTIRGSGQELASGKVVLVWAVIGPAEAKMPTGFLSQRYVRGKSASGQPAVLVGEKNPAIVLQSETNNGSEAHATITQMDLELTGIPV
jgi:hypothetical protein